MSLWPPGSLRHQLRALAASAAALLAATLATGCGSSQNTSAGLTSHRAEAATTSTASSMQSPRPAKRPPAPSRVPAVAKPTVVWDPIPFGPERAAQMVAYAERHYGLHTFELREPHVIVIHYTETPDFQSTYNTFAPDTPDSELHELPNTCAHYVIDRDGTIHQLVPLDIMCRHTVGLNWTAIGIEHVGYSDAEVLDNSRQMNASLQLVRWLRCTYHIQIANVIGHNESLSSPYHHENVPALRTQTHGDFDHVDMQTYRARLRAAGPC